MYLGPIVGLGEPVNPEPGPGHLYFNINWKIKKKFNLALIHRHCQTFPLSLFSSSIYQIIIKPDHFLSVQPFYSSNHCCHLPLLRYFAVFMFIIIRGEEDRLCCSKGRRKQEWRREQWLEQSTWFWRPNLISPFSAFLDLTPQSPICHHYQQIFHHYVWKLKFVCSTTFEFISSYLILNYFPLLLVID